MHTPFRLDEHRRRPQPPLAPPPDRYFEQLPMRVMQRVQTAPPSPAAWGWLAALSAPVRTALAAGVVLGGFAASFLLSPGAAVQPLATTSLAQVPRAELVQYLLASEQRVTLADLAEVPGAAQHAPVGTLQASPEELQELLDAQSADYL
ncbi:hypothetical protein ACFPAF_20345 [Hymenobacter endophyticus]|uniref:Uncharacterized protein n=1 Tax=Hymenobacter endophyticus TaxID=3076335 RepID=A0ABU3TN12_9BACT|nr:hypothetical protein [Hymenobacter endophyticus]MDU0372761.1 hypothetical protein [Hymenobacter endophyticus]